VSAPVTPRKVEYATPVPLLPEDCPIIGESPAIRRAVGLALRFAPTELPILLVGPTGSGKELFARQIHTWSRRGGAFVDINAGALPRDMVESLLFGHRRGAFTGAIEASRGLISAAEEGTLFLDELKSLALEGQAKLLRALETGEVRALGETVNRPVRCRFIGAVQEDVDRRIQRGEFRLDLYQRLAGVVIRLPALADRPEDIVPLARAFAAPQGRRIALTAEPLLVRYSWPGNVRELRSAVLRACFLSPDAEISAEVLVDALDLAASVKEMEGMRRITPMEAGPLIELCREHRWDVGSAARALGIGRSTLYRRLRESGVDPVRFRTLNRGSSDVDNWDGTGRDETA
jgi:DNA-binding NtrC family response regulator